jgi:hypothetical protein
MWPDKPWYEYVKDAVNEAKQIVTGSINAEAKVAGIGGGVNVGPVKLKGEVNVGKVKAKVKTDGTVKVEGKAFNLKGSAALGGKHTEGEVDVLKGSVTGNLKTGKVTAEGKILDANGKAEGGKVSLDNSLNIGVSGKFEELTGEVNVNFYHAAMAVGNLFQAASSYVEEKAKNIMHPENQVPPNARQNN